MCIVGRSGLPCPDSIEGSAKAAPAHENKAEPPLENKGVISGASLAPKPARAKASKA